MFINNIHNTSCNTCILYVIYCIQCMYDIYHIYNIYTRIYMGVRYTEKKKRQSDRWKETSHLLVYSSTAL